MFTIDLIANALDEAFRSAREPLTSEAIAEAVADKLTDEVVVANAVAALKADGWEETHGDGNGGHPDVLSDFDLANIARTVLRSVGGA